MIIFDICELDDKRSNIFLFQTSVLNSIWYKKNMWKKSKNKAVDFHLNILLHKCTNTFWLEWLIFSYCLLLCAIHNWTLIFFMLPNWVKLFCMWNGVSVSIKVPMAQIDVSVDFDVDSVTVLCLSEFGWTFFGTLTYFFIFFIELCSMTAWMLTSLLEFGFDTI